jgi:hypothetical protein
MKKLLSFGILMIALSCNKESDVEPATGTFLRYFGSEKNHTAVLAMEADNGFTMLSNVEVQTAADIGFKIKMTHTDLNGNFLWEQSYPAYREEPQDNTMTAASFIPLANSGYLIIGDRINPADERTDLQLLHLDLNGNMIASKTITGEDLDLDPLIYGGKNLHGHAIVAAEDANGANFLILGSIEKSVENNTDAPDMFVARINTDLSIGWTREYGASESSVVNRLYLTSDQSLFWTGSVNNYDQQDIRVVKVGKDSQLSFFGTPLPTPSINENASDICQATGGWALTGSTNEGGDDNIYLMKLSTNSEMVFYRNYGTTEETPEDEIVDFGLNDKGNSICQGTDGGLVMLATVEDPDTQQDMYLIKVDGISGNVVWKNSFGGDDRDEGASIRALSDGSYLVFGTSYFGRVRKLILMKVNKNGAL